jgi:phage-related minor tail protein
MIEIKDMEIKGMSKNLILKATKIKLDIEQVQKEIAQIKKDLKYVVTPELRAVADNMVNAKQLKIERLKTKLDELTDEIKDI